MAPSHPTTPKGHRTRSHILEVAAEIFAAEGYMVATMAEIAAAADLSMGGLYRYFDSKDGLFSVLVDEHNAVFLRALDGAWSDLDRRPITGCVAINRTLVRFWVSRAGLEQAIQEAVVVDPIQRRSVAETRERAVRGIVRRLSAAGLVTDPDATSLVVELLLDTTRRAARQVADVDSLSEDRTVDLLVDIWCAALIEPDAVTLRGTRGSGALRSGID